MEWKRKGKNPRSALVSALILASLLLVSSVEDECSACNAIADEIEIEFFDGLDSISRLERKDVDYRNGTQAVVEMLDGLCEKMLDHTLEKLDTGEEIWVRVHDWNNLPAGKDKQEAQKYSKYISSFCKRLLEDTKDELVELIKRSVLRPGQIGKALCQDLSSHCDESDDFDDDYMDEEL
ncbi:protein canopy-1-like isoform X2 [Phalaenopsis equestris]|uniref:protein canopy-1-like isoform X2 n=1 Tax=Phalaenopsis equestris TaxID=78828 RepID=UPI0009E3D9EE|nr:protein canopy-1-like isoform X2 [Phalaenopsis equestris]